MTPFSWHDAYYSELQSLYSLLVIPAAFIAYRLVVPADSTRGVVPKAARFVALATFVFAVLTMLDPIATGRLIEADAIAGTIIATAVPFLFVYLGDLRVLLTVLVVARPEERFAVTLGRAAAASTIVPITTGILYWALRAIVPDVHGLWLWMIYEAGFFALCVVAVRGWLPRAGVEAEGRAFIEALFGFSAAYYALWLAADVLIVVFSLDLGWAIRMVPNQLYYAVWTPFVYFRFFAASPAKVLR
jgi:hypothetical protein